MEGLQANLTEEAVDAMVQKYRKNYPSEVLDGDTMPSIRLLSVIHHSLKTGLAWIPWQHRLSQKQCRELMEARSSKWEIPVELSPGWFLNMQVVFSNALALCEACHLRVLKTYDKKIADLCLQQPDKASGLRTVTTHEMRSADQELWRVISSLLAEKWTLDDALHELSHVRTLVPSLLQLRPIVPKAVAQTPPPPPPSKKRHLQYADTPRQPSKKGKGKGNGKDQEQPSIPGNWPHNWDLCHGGKEICRRFQSNTCKGWNCKFAHICAIEGCQKAHSAKDHRAMQNKTWAE